MSILASCISVLGVNDVRVNHSHFDDPKKHLTPPANRLSHEVVVCHSLVESVNTQHVPIVLVNNREGDPAYLGEKTYYCTYII